VIKVPKRKNPSPEAIERFIEAFIPEAIEIIKRAKMNNQDQQSTNAKKR
jgi:hypothetical protein